MAKTAQIRTNPAPETGEARELTRTQPTDEEIAVRAYHIYLDRGEAEGDPINDWLQAERELTEDR